MAPKRQRKDEDEDEKPSKAQREEGTKAVEGLGQVHTNAEGESYIKLGEYRRLTVRKYQGRTLIDLRDYYKDRATGHIKPGAKGVSLTPEQWKMVSENVTKVDELITQL